MEGNSENTLRGSVGIVCSSEDLTNAKFKEDVKICTAPSPFGQGRRQDNYAPLGIMFLLSSTARSKSRPHDWLAPAAWDRPDSNRKSGFAVPRRGKEGRPA